jgi:tRNA threonylcarbamoyladenosine biosynthesis protein TsaE
MATLISHSPAETLALGEQWGRAAESGLVIGLSGDLGAGKTQFVKGMARGLGIAECVHSPTFALVNIYAGGRLTLFHVDLYRLDTQEQIAAAGLDDYLKPLGVTVVEWAERWLGEMRSAECGVRSQDTATTHHAERFRWLQIEVLSETERRITYEDSGT